MVSETCQELFDFFFFLNFLTLQLKTMSFISCVSQIPLANNYFHGIFDNMVAGDKAQSHSEPYHSPSVVLRLQQGGFPRA